MNQPYEVYWVNPNSVKYGSGNTFSPIDDSGKVIGGDWDLENPNREVANSLWLISSRERIMEGRSWEQTSIYKKGLESINLRGKWHRHDSEESLRKRFVRFENLLQNIKKKGYLVNPDKEDVSVNIGRNGEIRFNDGIHRLCIAQVLKLDRIPVQIVVRHPEWIKFKNKLAQFATQQRGRIYHPVTHPDLQHIRIAHDDSRFDMIKNNLTFTKGKLLDIGAYLGFFCFKFEDLGFDCYAVEQEQQLVYFMTILKKAEYKRFNIIAKSIFNLENMKFDIVLALNVFHHFLKKKKTFDQLKELLLRIDMKEMFFQAHNPNGPQMRRVYANFNPNKFADFIIENSCLSEGKNIGNTKDGRTLFKLWS